MVVPILRLTKVSHVSNRSLDVEVRRAGLRCIARTVCLADCLEDLIGVEVAVVWLAVDCQRGVQLDAEVGGVLSIH